MKKIKILSLSIIAIMQTNAIAADRMCFNTVEKYNDFPSPTTNGAVIEIADYDHPNFGNTQKKCDNYLPYYAGKVKDATGNLITSKNCLANAALLDLKRGYAPLGVFFRGTKSNIVGGKITSYKWNVFDNTRGKDITDDILVAKNTSTPIEPFNMAHVFEMAGTYTVKLTITDDKGGSYPTATTTVEVWERDKKTYYVDSVWGDDRFNGLSQTPISGCDVNTSPVGTCAGPWKTATKAFAESTKTYNIEASNFPSGKYTAAATCKSLRDVEVTAYNAGVFITYRDNLFPNMALKNPDGSVRKNTSKACDANNFKTGRAGLLRPGDQVLFKSGQSFELETGIGSVDVPYTATASDGKTYSYQSYDCKSLAQTGHWTPSMGVLYASSDKNGAKPLIQNVGETSCPMLNWGGVGQMGFAMQDLKFNLESPNNKSLIENRADFLYSPADPINSVFLRTEFEKFSQGIVLPGRMHGIFLKDNKSFDSHVVHFFTESSAKDIALIGNTMDYSGNHIAYTSNANAFIFDNTFSKPAFGRTALRIAGGPWDDPNRYNWVSNNKFEGWIDPRTSKDCNLITDPACRAFNDGKSYNYSLINLSPNVQQDLALRDIVFKDNKLTDSANFIMIGDAERLTVNKNIFDTLDNSASPRIAMSNMATRPNKDITISYNTFTDRSSTVGEGVSSSVISTSNYFEGPKCTDVATTSNIKITNNIFNLSNQRKIIKHRLLQGTDLNGLSLPELSIEEGEKAFSNIISFTDNDVDVPDVNQSIFQIGGIGNVYIKEPTATDSFNSEGFYDGIEGKSPYRLYNSVGSVNKLTVKAPVR